MKTDGTTEQFVKLPRALVQSRAWQSAGINTHRLLWFLMLEHMTHGGKRNGHLAAPRKQLTEFGIAERYISGAIIEAASVGLIDVIRGAGRAANRYAITWLPLADGSQPSNRWRHYTGDAA